MNYKIDCNLFKGMGAPNCSHGSSEDLPITIRVVHAKDGNRYSGLESRYDIDSLGHDAYVVYTFLDTMTNGCTAVYDIETVRESTGWDDSRLAGAFRELGRNGFLISCADMEAFSESESSELRTSYWQGQYLFLAESVRNIAFLDDYFEFCGETWGDSI